MILYNFFRHVWDTIHLDIRWINYFWGSRPDYLINNLGAAYKNHTLLREILRYPVKIFNSLLRRFTFKSLKNGCRGGILFYVDSTNQWRAVNPICRASGERGALWIDGDFKGDLLFPGDLARLVGAFFLPVLLFRMVLNKPPLKLWTLSYSLGNYLDVYGYYFIGYLWLKKIQPTVLVVANDHTSQPRALVKAAQQLSIPTAYVQHAPVTEDFPPLEFDYALLDGEVAKSTYKIHNQRCQVILVGMARRIRITPANITTPNMLYIGVALNELDDVCIVEKLLSDLSEKIPQAKLIIRAHPEERPVRIKIFQELATRFNAKFSNSKDESPWDFLRPLSILVAGNSGIMLEAGFSGVIPIQFQPLVNGYDHYGFSREGVIKTVDNADQILNVVGDLEKHRSLLQNGLNKFDASFGTAEDGKAAQVAADVLLAIS